MDQLDGPAKADQLDWPAKMVLWSQRHGVSQSEASLEHHQRDTDLISLNSDVPYDLMCKPFVNP